MKTSATAGSPGSETSQCPLFPFLQGTPPPSAPPLAPHFSPGQRDLSVGAPQCAKVSDYLTLPAALSPQLLFLCHLLSVWGSARVWVWGVLPGAVESLETQAAATSNQNFVLGRDPQGGLGAYRLLQVDLALPRCGTDRHGVRPGCVGRPVSVRLPDLSKSHQSSRQAERNRQAFLGLHLPLGRDPGLSRPARSGPCQPGAALWGYWRRPCKPSTPSWALYPGRK